VRRVGKEQGVPSKAFDLIEGFVSRLPDGGINDVLSSFGMLASRRAAA
jgi:hypothetical protein